MQVLDLVSHDTKVYYYGLFLISFLSRFLLFLSPSLLMGRWTLLICSDVRTVRYLHNDYSVKEHFELTDKPLWAYLEMYTTH